VYYKVLRVGTTGVARNFDWRGECFLTVFGDVMNMTSPNDVITDFLKFDFVIISLKKQNLATSRNFRTPKSKIKGPPSALGDF